MKTKTTGIMLAGGEASRMPNKALLPVGVGDVVIETGIHYMMSVAKCDEIIVVVSPHSPIKGVLQMRGVQGVRFIEQPVARGVPDAVRRACDVANCENVLVTFCDNVYSHAQEAPIDELHASVRWADNSRQLDAYSTLAHQWVRRSTDDDLESPSLLGWYILNRSAVCDLAEVPMSSVEFLNTLDVQPHEYSSKVWDIGTPDAYQRYLDHHNRNI